MILAACGVLLSLLLLLRPAPRPEKKSDAASASFNWLRMAQLCGLMVFYGLTLRRVGFLLATTLFLGGGFFLLGERRLGFLTALPLATAAGFQVLLHGVLGIYIDDPFLSLLGLVE